MKSLDNLVMLLFLSITLICMPATATGMVGADRYNLGEGEVLEDDLIVAGGTIMIDGDVSGDLIAAGRVDDDAWIAGGSLFIDGEVGDDLRAAGCKAVGRWQKVSQYLPSPATRFPDAAHHPSCAPVSVTPT